LRHSTTDSARGSRRRGGRVGSDRRVPGQGLPGAGWRWHSVLSPARAPGGSRTRRDPHLQLASRLPPLPRGALAGSSAEPFRNNGPASGLTSITQPSSRSERSPGTPGPRRARGSRWPSSTKITPAIRSQRRGDGRPVVTKRFALHNNVPPSNRANVAGYGTNLAPAAMTLAGGAGTAYPFTRPCPARGNDQPSHGDQPTCSHQEQHSKREGRRAERIGERRRKATFWRAWGTVATNVLNSQAVSNQVCER
jgi:hypothetical protein